MDALVDNISANRAMRRYLAHAEGKLPDDLFAKVSDLVDSNSTVDAVCNTAELLYANRDKLDDEGKTIVAQLAAYAAQGPWQWLGENGRGLRVAVAMRRELGEKPGPGQAKFPAAKDDPEPLKHYVPAADDSDKAA